MKTDNTADHHQNIINALDALLERERAALLSGDLESIAHLLEEKEALFDRLNAIPQADSPNLNALKGKVQRNQALLDNALKGIRAVAARMSAMRKIRRSLDTYDESGKRTTIEGQKAAKLEKRA